MRFKLTKGTLQIPQKKKKNTNSIRILTVIAPEKKKKKTSPDQTNLEKTFELLHVFGIYYFISKL